MKNRRKISWTTTNFWNFLIILCGSSVVIGQMTPYSGKITKDYMSFRYTFFCKILTFLKTKADESLKDVKNFPKKYT